MNESSKSAAASGDGTAPTVNVDATNFNRAESHYFMKKRVEAGMFGHFKCVKQPGTADDQIVVRMNRDVLFAWAILDLTQPATITLPEANGRYMSLRVVNEDHYVTLSTYEAGQHVITRELNGTRYAHLAVRFFVDPADPADLAQANALQDLLKIEQSNSGSFEVPNWDQVSRLKVSDGFKLAGSTLRSFDRMFGAKADVDPVLHLIGVAGGWGGGPPSDSTYISATPEHNDGQTAYTLTVPADVPVDGFWSLTVYTKEGYFKKNESDLYSRNNKTSVPNADGSITIRFGGDPEAPNYLPIFPDWNYTVRLYRSRPEVLNKQWTFPGPEEVK